MEHCQKVMFFGGIGVSLGSVLAWGLLFNFFGQTSFYGFVGEGILVLGSGLAISILSLSSRRPPNQPCSLKASLLALVALLISSPALFSVPHLDFSDKTENSLSILMAAGLVIILLSSLIAMISGVRSTERPVS